MRIEPLLLLIALAGGCSRVDDLSQSTEYAAEVPAHKHLLRDVTLCPYEVRGLKGLQMLDRPDGYCVQTGKGKTVAAGQLVSVNKIELHTTYELFVSKHIYAVGAVSLGDRTQSPFFFDLGGPEVAFCAPWQERKSDCQLRSP